MSSNWTAETKTNQQTGNRIVIDENAIQRIASTFGSVGIEQPVAQSTDVIMAWEIRGANRYYYRTMRVDGVVKKEYVGRGSIARLAAVEDESARRKRELERQEVRVFRDAVQPLPLLMKDLADGERMLVHAELLAAGFHQNKGTWRKRRGG